MRFEGIITPVVTPCDADHSIDFARFEALLEHLVASGVHGIVVAGTTGEYYAQTTEERIETMRAACRIVGGRVPVIVGTGAIRTEDSVSFAEQARAAGADAILAATPPYACPTGEEIALHILAVERAAGLPVMLYNYPARMSVDMDRQTLDQLAENPNIRAIKESSGNIDRLHMLANDYPNLQLSCGMDDQALEFFAWGARSWVCAGSNFAPQAHLALHDACVVNGDFEKGRRIMSAMLPLMRLLEQGGKFVQCIKHGVTMRGIDCGPPRKPLQPLHEEEQRDLEIVIRTLDRDLAEIDAKPGRATA